MGLGSAGIAKAGIGRGGEGVCGGCVRVARFEPGFVAAVVVGPVVVLVGARLVPQDTRWILVAGLRYVEEDVFDCRVGEDESEEEEAEEVVAAVPGPSRKVLGVAAEWS